MRRGKFPSDFDFLASLFATAHTGQPLPSSSSSDVDEFQPKSIFVNEISSRNNKLSAFLFRGDEEAQ